MSGSSDGRKSGIDADELLDALGDKYSAEILCAAESPISAQDLSEEIDVPIATCYRRIEELVDAGLLTSEGRQLSEEGRRTTVYRRTIDEITVDFEDDRSPDLSLRERAEATPARGETD